VNVSISDEQSALPISSSSAETIVERVIKGEGQTCDEVSVFFVTTEEICRLHRYYFDDPSITDCISFPIDEDPATGYRVLGDVFVCPQTAIDFARDHKGDPYEETTLYIVHGLLHLMGYDDIDDEDAAAMRQAEERHMKRLKTSGCYLKREEAI